MKTLIFNGSPRPNGDTVSLIRIVTEHLTGEYRIIDAYRCGISPCVDCRHCWTHAQCALSDEMQSVYADIIACDNILIASPVYFSELTGKMLDVMSRLQLFFAARFFRQEELITLPKKGAIILVGGGDGKMDKAHSTARILLHQMQCHDIHELVFSHNTNSVPALQDAAAVQGAIDIARFFNQQ